MFTWLSCTSSSQPGVPCSHLTRCHSQDTELERLNCCTDVITSGSQEPLLPLCAQACWPDGTGFGCHPEQRLSKARLRVSFQKLRRAASSILFYPRKGLMPPTALLSPLWCQKEVSVFWLLVLLDHSVVKTWDK